MSDYALGALLWALLIIVCINDPSALDRIRACAFTLSLTCAP